VHLISKYEQIIFFYLTCTKTDSAFIKMNKYSETQTLNITQILYKYILSNMYFISL